eukprot:GHVU01224378.1.p1 GENE.GHVU01224378.1~~GHVU01224378.1.p1  ORF type:complete len:222 (+),score=40.78 GHVU01224378.1:11-676(+)
MVLSGLPSFLPFVLASASDSFGVLEATRNEDLMLLRALLDCARSTKALRGSNLEGGGQEAAEDEGAAAQADHPFPSHDDDSRQAQGMDGVESEHGLGRGTPNRIIAGRSAHRRAGAPSGEGTEGEDEESPLPLIGRNPLAPPGQSGRMGCEALHAVLQRLLEEEEEDGRPPLLLGIRRRRPHPAAPPPAGLSRRSNAETPHPSPESSGRCVCVCVCACVCM